MRAFVECRIKPYYLHHGDLAPGTAHLRTTLAAGPGIDARLAGAGVRTVPAGLRARYSRRPRQGAGRPELSVDCKFFFARSVNGRRKRAIVSSIIAATFISILRSHDRSMTDGGGAAPEPPEDQGNRSIENAVMLGFFVVLVAAGIWLLGTMADVRKVQDCAAQGRRNCATIEIPDRARRCRWEKQDAKAGHDMAPSSRPRPLAAIARRRKRDRRAPQISRDGARSAGRSPSAARRPGAVGEKPERSERSAQPGRRRARPQDQEHLPRLLETVGVRD